MTSVLGHNSYGKSQVRLVKVTRRADRHELTDLTVDVALEGDFDRRPRRAATTPACWPPTRCATRSTPWPRATTTSPTSSASGCGWSSTSSPPGRG